MLDTEKALSINEVAEILNTTRQSVAKLCKATGANRLPHRRIGKHYRFAKSAVMAWLGEPTRKSTQAPPATVTPAATLPICDEYGIDHAAIAKYFDELPPDTDVMKGLL
jgi:excisionase family DNA binding protein